MGRVITITANPLLDFVTDEAVAVGRINRVARLEAVAEGKGVNVARVLVAHGHQAVALGFAGGPSGAWLAQLVGQAGIEARFTATATPLRVGCMAGIPPTTILASGFAVTAAEAMACLAELERQLGGSDLVVVSGSVPDPSLAAGFYPAIFTRCAEAGVPCWLDSYGPAAEAALAGPHRPLLGKPNTEEYTTTTGWQHCPEVHRSAGAAGLTVLLAGREAWRVRPPVIRERNPIGSGDCYLGALAHGRLQGWEPERTLAYAAAAGALNAASPTVAELDPPAIMALSGQAIVERLPS